MTTPTLPTLKAEMTAAELNAAFHGYHAACDHYRREILAAAAAGRPADALVERLADLNDDRLYLGRATGRFPR